MEADFENGLFWISSFDGFVHQYKFNGKIGFDSIISRQWTTKTADKIRTLKFWPNRNELYIGHAKGRLTVLDLDNYEHPICKSN